MHPDWDPFSPDVRTNPAPHYARLREQEPVGRCEARGFWIISRHSDAVSVLSNPADFSSAKGVGPDKAPGVPMMLTRDPPDHTRLRSIVSKAFTPRMIAGLEPRIRAVADHLIDRATERRSFDWVSAVARPLPLVVIAEILGVDTGRCDDIKRWSSATFEVLAGRVTPEAFEEYRMCWNEHKALMTAEIAARRASPRDDLLGVLCASAGGDGALRPSEILNATLLLLAAGNETTTDLIGNAVAALAAHPEEVQRLRRNPGLAASAIEEVLRWDSPVQGLFRTTTRSVSVRGVTIPEDSKVMVHYGSANRDPEVFSDPDRFDVARAPNRHLAFGHGIHFCLGAQLARLEARVVLEALLRRTIRFEVDLGRAVRQDNPLLRGFDRLPIFVDPAARSESSPLAWSTG